MNKNLLMKWQKKSDPISGRYKGVGSEIQKIK